MKIAYINQTYPPMVTGVSHMLCHLAKGMAARGHSVLVIVASDSGRPYTTAKAGLKIVRLRSYQNPMAAGQRFMAWPKWEIETLLESFAPDVIHFHDPMLASTVRPSGGSRRPVPTVLTAHIHPGVADAYAAPVAALQGLVQRGTGAAAGWLYRHCDVVVSPSHMIADYVAETGRCRARVISNGIDLQRFHPEEARPGEAGRLAATFGFHPERPVILHVGRLSREKNIPALVRAAALAMQVADAQLVVAGNGPEKESLIRLSEDLGIAERTFFPGFVFPDGDLPGLYRLASVFVSASEIEAQGLVLLEAAASGTPLVAVRAAAAPEIVIEGVSGSLVEPGDVRAMADRMVEILQDPVQARSMGRAGRRLAENHALENTYAAHERLYMDLAAQPHTPPGTQLAGRNREAA